MNKIIKYKGYEGTAEVDMETFQCRGKILFINDLVTYQAPDPKMLVNEFETAVDDYLETCEILGREPQKPLKGQFNVRVSPELHKQAVARAICDGTSLNKIVVNALEHFLVGTTEVNHHLTVNMNIPSQTVTFAASGSTAPEYKEVFSNVH